MFWFFQPSKKPTPAEYSVLVVFVAIVFIVLEVAALIVGFRAPVQKHALAVILEYRGAVCLGVGAAILAGYWLYRQLSQ